MRYPSIHTIETRLNLDHETAKRARGLIDGSIDPETVPETAAWVKQAYGPISSHELRLHAVDAVLGNFGVELLGASLGPWYRYAPQYSYSNAGDTYAPTVIRNNETGRYLITDVGTLAESGKVKGE